MSFDVERSRNVERRDDPNGLQLLRAIDLVKQICQGAVMNAMDETTATELGAMIVSTPGILGGKPRIKGHRVGVHRIAGWWKLGLSVEAIGERLTTLTPAEIHAALAYYHLHHEDIDNFLEEERAVCHGLERHLPTQP